MATKTAAATAVLFSVLALWVTGKVESASPAVDCTSVVLNLADCLSYVSNGSDVDKPEGTCCSGLKTVVKTNPECLCEGFKNSAQMGVSLNMTKALALPSACHVPAPPLSECGLSLAPNAAPPVAAATPPTTVVVSPSTPAAGSTESTGANEVAPVPPPESSGSTGLTTAIGAIFMAVLVASFSFF
ncbi:hypothetical protein NMG60_11032653 [Bertholletia excelsa]